MAGISIISSFDVKEERPIDSRLVATNSTARENTPYKYEGLKVYQTDNRLTYTYIGGNTWIVEERGGIYGGSGSLVGDTFVNFGTISNTVGNESNDLVWRSASADNTVSYLYNNFYRHTSESSPFGYRGTEFRQQFKYFNGSNLIDSAYISFNPLRAPGEVTPGALAFSTGFGNTLKENVRISNQGNLGIATTDPKGYIQIGTSSTTTSPLVLHNSTQSVIGYNWYFDGTSEQTFNISRGQTKLVSDATGSFQVWNRRSGASFVNTIHTQGSGLGRVGIRTSSPSVEFDVNGRINSNSTISGLIVTAGTVSSDNRVTARQYTFNQALSNLNLSSPTSIFTYPLNTFSTTDYLILRSSGTNSISTDGSRVNLIKTDVYGDLDVTGKITNNEPSTSLVALTTLGRNTGTQEFNVIITPSFLSVQYCTYSISAYRVGAMANVNLEFTFLIDFNLGDNEFYGIQMWIVDPSYRFVPEGSAFGSGIGFTSSVYVPLVIESFQTDPSGGGAPDYSLTSNNFYLRLRTTKISGNIGSEFLNNQSIKNGTKFKGTISYKVRDVSPSTPSTTPPTPPFVVSEAALNAYVLTL
jgi:hypothetical protein